MGLSNDLISQFVKATNDRTKTKSDTKTYGTIVEYNGSKYIRLDGSELLTPIKSTVSVSDGDRATVTIKNHSAIVDGNLSDPSASSGTVTKIGAQISEFEIIIADKVSTKELDAERARIEELIAEDVIIKGTLQANRAEIDDLIAEDITINGILTATKADIDHLTTNKLDASVADIKYATIGSLEATDAKINNLQATYGDFEVLTTNKFTAIDGIIDDLETNKLDAETANITYATITDLNSAKANIGTLNSDMADINTLIFGSASGDVIHTSFANAVIAQLGNAQIKSAMIESLSADKITAGDIITNNVRVLSEDGKLLISDETIQISDTNRVRVQIGKDAANDYSINIWDEAGNLMFSEGGITDSAIKEAIIRNDMVSETANISASKLDIDSLFEEINGSTKTIKSTKIYLDDKKQTLDVAFTSLISDLDTLDGLVTAQGTNLSVVQGQISSKVWQSDINTAVNPLKSDITTLNNSYSSVNQNLNNITAIVGNHTTEISKKADDTTVTKVQNKVSELELGLEGFQSTVSDTYATKIELGIVSDTVNSKNQIHEGSGNPNYTGAGTGPLFINLVEYATETAGGVDIYDVDGYADGYRWSMSGGSVQGNTPQGRLTGWIPYTANAVYRIKNMGTPYMQAGYAYTNYAYFVYISKTGTIKSIYLMPTEEGVALDFDNDLITYNAPYDIDSCAYFRISGVKYDLNNGTSDPPIITCNEEIIYGDTPEAGNPYSPSVTWKAEKTESDHIGDLYVDTDTNYMYRWCMYNGEYTWLRVEDRDVKDLENRVTKAETTITQNTTNITASATRIANNAASIASLQLTADGLTSRVSNNETDIATALINAANAQDDIDNLEIGGRNLIPFNKIVYSGTTLLDGVSTKYMKLLSSGQYDGISIPYDLLELNTKYVLHYDLKLLSGPGTVGGHSGLSSSSECYVDGVHTGAYTNAKSLEANKKVHVVVYITTGSSVPVSSPNIFIQSQRGSNSDSLIDMEYEVENLKIEYGNAETDWTPAPEDMATSGMVDGVNEQLDSTNDRITRTESIIQQLRDCISMLVTDENGESLMTVTSTGWTFSMKSVSDTMSSLSDSLSSLQNTTGDTQATVGKLQNAINDLEETAAYVRVEQYEDEPCIELGKSDSEFKLLITNTRIMFRKGSGALTYIDTTGLVTENITIRGELHHGNWMWKQRSNGNYGIQYIG